MHMHTLFLPKPALTQANFSNLFWLEATSVHWGRSQGRKNRVRQLKWNFFPEWKDYANFFVQTSSMIKISTQDDFRVVKLWHVYLEFFMLGWNSKSWSITLTNISFHFLNRPITASLSLFSSFLNCNWQISTFKILYWVCWDSNHGSLVSEATTLPTALQPRPSLYFVSS